MDFNKRIDEISKKYKYDNELTEALKRCIPAMVKGKSNSEIELLLETLERVEILDLKEQPTAQQLNEIEREKINEKNEHVKFVTGNKGEYGKKDAPGAYQSIAIFDENMDIVDRVRYIYLTRLSEYTKETKKYQTTINLSHLVHELGHAWSAQKEKINNILRQNELVYQESLKEKYNPELLFKKKDCEIEEKKQLEKNEMLVVSMTEYKENIFIKLIKKIKNNLFGFFK